MKKLFVLLLPVFPFLANAQPGQDLSDVEVKYSNVVIWGLETRSKKDFLTEITSLPEGICQQSLRKMGYPDGTKIPIQGKILVTLRNNPAYQITPIYKAMQKKQKPVDLDKWHRILPGALGFYESQQLPYFLQSLALKDSARIDELFQTMATEFKDYGIVLNKQKIFDAYALYNQSTARISKQEVLSLLYFTDNDSLQQAANFIAAHYIRTDKDLLDFMPLLLKNQSNIQIPLQQFLKEAEVRINWSRHIELLGALINHPNPFKAVLSLKIADNTGFNKKDLARLLQQDLQTLREILSADFLEAEKTFVLTFLNKYAALPAPLSAQQWREKLHL